MDYLIKEATLTDIANAIRSKTSSQSSIMVSDFATEIQNIPSGGLPTGTWEDPLSTFSGNTTRYNLNNVASGYYVDEGALAAELIIQLASASGYEGCCIDLSKYNLTPGTSYTASFELECPGVTFSGSYPWGVKYSSTRVPESGNANGTTFNIVPDVNFLQQAAKQNVSITFTANSGNFLLILLSRVSASLSTYIYLRKFTITEVE